MENGNPSRVALFLDAENLIIEAQKSGLPVEIKRVMDRVREEGVVSVARAYADWTEPHTQAHALPFYDQVLELTQLDPCFEVVGEERFSNEFGQNRLRPAPGMDAQQALRLVNEIYVNGICMDYPQVTFQERALALLLFDRDSELHEVSEILTAIGYYRR